VLLRFEVLRRMARGLPTVLAFYAATALLCLLGGAALYAGLMHDMFYVLPVLATALFLYARLAGRLTRVLGRIRLKGGPKADPAVRRAAREAEVEDPWGEPRKASPPPRRRKKKKKAAPEVHDPWAVPEDEEEAGEKQASLPVEGYGLATEEEPRKKRRPEAEKPPPVEGYEVSAEPPPPRPKVAPLDGSPPVGVERALSEQETPLPDRALIDGVWTFPWYPNSVIPWVVLSFLFLAWGYVLSVMQSVRPF
jgi:hypothetical protein